MGWWWGFVLGPVLVLLGLTWPGWIRFRIPWFSLRARPVMGFWGAFLLAAPFTVAVCPICTPALIVALMAAAGVGSIPFGAALLLAFALGRSVPIVLGAAAIGWLESLKLLTRWQKGFEIAGGLALIISGVYLIQQSYLLT
jgi:cytochrome c-type biogenesis protein